MQPPPAPPSVFGESKPSIKADELRPHYAERIKVADSALSKLSCSVTQSVLCFVPRPDVKDLQSSDSGEKTSFLIGLFRQSVRDNHLSHVLSHPHVLFAYLNANSVL